MSEYPIPDEYRTLAAGAQAVLGPGLSGGTSPFDPGVTTWTADSAADILARVRDGSDTTPGSFMAKLPILMADAARPTVLLMAELLYLESLPLDVSNIGEQAKRSRVEQALQLLPDKPAVPAALGLGWTHPGAFSGGTGITRLGPHLLWLARFVEAWTALDVDSQRRGGRDPRAFAEIAATVTGEPSMRRSLCFLQFPGYFEPVLKTEDRKAIRDAFSAHIGGATGDHDPQVDADLFQIRQALQAHAGTRINWYGSPWAGQWRGDQMTTDQRAWLLRPREVDLADWLADGFVSMAASKLGDVPPGSSIKAIRAAVEKGYRHVDYSQRKALTAEYHALLSQMKPEDLVVTQEGDHIHLGLVAGQAQYTDMKGSRLRREVSWRTKVAVDEMADIEGLLDLQGTVVDVTAGIEEFRDLIERGATQRPREDRVPTLRSATDELAAGLHMDRDHLQEILDLLQHRQQIVLYGPPGTGKTYLAMELARHIVGPEDRSRVQLVQFHPSYAYEDFFEGFRPKETDAGQASFELTDGPLRRIASAATAEPGVPHVLVIDEINRANLAKVFGELYFLLEYRKESIGLQYNPGEAFQLPRNLFFIGTMNTADRSIALLDAAMRRRFSFVELHPDEPPVRDVLSRWLAVHEHSAERAALLRALNAAIEEQDRDLRIGPSYLMRDEAKTEQGLQRVWRYDILPLLEEHYYGRLSREQVHDRFGLDGLRATLAGVDAADDEQP